MLQEIFLAAKTFGALSLSPDQDAALEAFCQAAAHFWSDQLKPGVHPEDCHGFVSAAAWFALANFCDCAPLPPNPASFSAGDLSVHFSKQDHTLLARNLRQQALCLMLPYLKQNPLFAFQGVRG